MIGKMIGFGFTTSRDALARRLIKLGATPNMLTIAGMLFTAGSAVCYAIGTDAKFAWSLDPSASANAYLLLAFWGLILASACDMLDGAVARIGHQSTRFGAFFDSTLDRYSDFVVYAGISAHYAWQTPANLTFVLLPMLAFFNALMISYTRARAEDLIESCTVGYWQRGERSAAILIGTASYNIPAMVLQQAILPLLTVVSRINYTRLVLNGHSPITDPRKGNWWLKIQLWKWPRMTVPYDLVTGINIAWLIIGPVGANDVLRNWLGG